MSTLSVNVAVIDDNKVLLIKREDFPIWGLPGGGVEDGESLAQAAIRETQEETGVSAKLTHLMGVYSRPQWINGGNHEILFKATPVSGVLRPQDGETVDVHYFSIDELPSAITWWHRQRIQDVFDNLQGIVRSQNVTWPLETENRNEVYQLRDQGKLPLRALFTEFCGPTPPGMDIIEVGDKND